MEIMLKNPHLAPGTIIFDKLFKLSSKAPCLIFDARISCFTLKIFSSKPYNSTNSPFLLASRWS
jgi:hypothetical protein